MRSLDDVLLPAMLAALVLAGLSLQHLLTPAAGKVNAANYRPPAPINLRVHASTAYPEGSLGSLVAKSTPAGRGAVKEVEPPIRVREFLGLTFCKVGWTGEGCSVEVPRPACVEPDGSCFEHPEYGIASVSNQRWLAAKRAREESEAAGVDYEQLNKEHRAKFLKYDALPEQLGDVAQFAGGPFPLVSDMLASGHRATSVTLLEPRALRFLNPRNPGLSAYYQGNISVQAVGATSIIPLPPRDQPAPAHRYDTVVMVGALEAVPDAFDALERSYHMLRPGGTFVWHERLWDVPPPGVPRTPHAIRLKSAFAQRFTSLFEPLLDLRNSHALYFIGRKRLHDGLPLPPPQVQPLPLMQPRWQPHAAGGGYTRVADPGRMPDGQITVVLLTHPTSRRVPLLLQVMKRYMRMPVVRHILLLLNGAVVPFDMKPFEGKLIIKYFRVNSMNNRLRISAEVSTEMVLWMDDDVQVEEELLRCLHRAWLREPDRMIGLDAKGVKYGELTYDGKVALGKPYTYVAGKTMLFHHSYLDAYLRDEVLTRYVNPEVDTADPSELNFCEDLGLVALVGAMSGKPPLVVETQGGKEELHTGGIGLSTATGWDSMRTRCVIWFEGHFGMMASPAETRRGMCTPMGELAE